MGQLNTFVTKKLVKKVILVKKYVTRVYYERSRMHTNIRFPAETDA